MADSNQTKSRCAARAWFGLEDRDGFLHRSWMKNQGIPHDEFDGRPVIGICNTWSELTPCNAHFRELAEYVKKGVLEAGGLPLEFPVMIARRNESAADGDAVSQPRHAMDVEESIRGNPMDGVILLVGCDKTTPALLMGAASCNLPSLAVSGGPMLNGRFPRQAYRLGHAVSGRCRGSARRRDDAGRIHRSRVVHEPLARPLHDDGHGVDDGHRWSNRSAWACRRTRRFRPSTHGVSVLAHHGQAGASSTWFAKI